MCRARRPRHPAIPNFASAAGATTADGKRCIRNSVFRSPPVPAQDGGTPSRGNLHAGLTRCKRPIPLAWGIRQTNPCQFSAKSRHLVITLSYFVANICQFRRNRAMGTEVREVDETDELAGLSEAELCRLRTRTRNEISCLYDTQSTTGRDMSVEIKAQQERLRALEARLKQQSMGAPR